MPMAKVTREHFRKKLDEEIIIEQNTSNESELTYNPWLQRTTFWIDGSSHSFASKDGLTIHTQEIINDFNKFNGYE